MRWHRAHVARLLVRPHLLIHPGARLAWWWRRGTGCLTVLVRVRWLRRRVDLGEPIGGPVSWSWAGWWSGWCWRRCLRGGSPLRPWWTHGAGGLVCIGVHILRNRRRGVHRGHALSASEKLQACLDVDIAGIQLVRALVRIERIADLIVARLVLQVWVSNVPNEISVTREHGAYKSAKVVPDLGNVRVEAYRAGVRIECVSVLVDLVIQDSNGAPESRVPAITVDSLLVCLVCLGVLLL